MGETPVWLFVGGGNMASAIITGATHAGRLDSGRVVVVEPDAERRTGFARGVGSFKDGLDVALGLGGAGALRVVLAVKPQVFSQIAGELRAALAGRGASPTVVSILAGVRTATIRALLGVKRAVRVMPNTPAVVGQGMTAIAGGPGATAGDVDEVVRLFEGVGRVVRIDESLMDAFTALAGSGPAYLFLLAEAMARAARAQGFGQDAAEEIVRQTLLGASTLLSRSGEDAGGLRRRVTSKGGTTAAALESFERDGFTDTVIRAVDAATARGRELGA